VVSAWAGDRFSVGILIFVSWLSLALLVCAVAVVIGAEWPRLSERLGAEARRKRERARRKAQLRVLRSESDEFAASVERDLDQLPTIEDYDHRNSS
jgi:hypothetical protein